MANSRAVNELLTQIRIEVGKEYVDDLSRLMDKLAAAQRSNDDIEKALLERIDKAVADLPAEAPYYGDGAREQWPRIRRLVR